MPYTYTHTYIYIAYIHVRVCVYTVYMNVWVYICKQQEHCGMAVLSSRIVAQYSLWRSVQSALLRILFPYSFGPSPRYKHILMLSISVIALSFAWEFSLSPSQKPSVNIWCGTLLLTLLIVPSISHFLLFWKPPRCDTCGCSFRLVCCLC